MDRLDSELNLLNGIDLLIAQLDDLLAVLDAEIGEDIR